MTAPFTVAEKSADTRDVGALPSQGQAGSGPQFIDGATFTAQDAAASMFAAPLPVDGGGAASVAAGSSAGTGGSGGVIVEDVSDPTMNAAMDAAAGLSAMTDAFAEVGDTRSSFGTLLVAHLGPLECVLDVCWREHSMQALQWQTRCARQWMTPHTCRRASSTSKRPTLMTAATRLEGTAEGTPTRFGTVLRAH